MNEFKSPETKNKIKIERMKREHEEKIKTIEIQLKIQEERNQELLSLLREKDNLISELRKPTNIETDRRIEKRKKK